MTGRLRIAVLVDRMTVARWQLEALRTLGDDAELLLYSCTNSRPGRHRFRHALYYLLNLLTIRNHLTRPVPVRGALPIAEEREFEAGQVGGWQELPSTMLERFRADGVSVIIKFGLGLLRVPPDLEIPILSYHHGDPAHFRGRPAGFYEMLEDVPVLGQVVQRLSNVLDAGDIVASAETKVFAHSYRATLVEAFGCSPLILKQAVANCLEGRNSRAEQLGANRRLPSNFVVLGFLLKLLRHAVTRVLYGLFKEKVWSVATLQIGDEATVDSLAARIADRTAWRPVPVPAGYHFLADPFFHPDGGLLVEALNARSCGGEVLVVGETGARRLSRRGGHYSYPAIVQDGDRDYVVPEISDWSTAKAFPLGHDELADPIELLIPGRPHLLDPTPFAHEGRIYLFGNVTSEGASVLRLWFADSIGDAFSEHPCSPIRISPNGSRMGGAVRRLGGRLIRFGQDGRRSYGDGLTAFEIIELSERNYCEASLSSLRFADCCGPHTVNLERGEAAFDFYVERFSPFAGVRRWRHRRAARRTD